MHFFMYFQFLVVSAALFVTNRQLCPQNYEADEFEDKYFIDTGSGDKNLNLPSPNNPYSSSFLTASSNVSGDVLKVPEPSFQIAQAQEVEYNIPACCYKVDDGMSPCEFLHGIHQVTSLIDTIRYWYLS